MADLEHATENDNDLHGDADAAHWAERFASKFAVVRRDAAPGEDEMPDTEGLMLAWFAGAIETGRMQAQLPPFVLPESASERVLADPGWQFLIEPGFPLTVTGS